MKVDFIPVLMLSVLACITAWTDIKYRKIYNKVLVPAWALALIWHGLNGMWLDSLKASGLAFFLFFLVYMMNLTSAGDVKYYAVLGAVMASVQTVVLSFLTYTVMYLAVAVYAGMKSVKWNIPAFFVLLKRDAFAFMARSGPVMEPVRFPAAVLISISVIIGVIGEVMR